MSTARSEIIRYSRTKPCPVCETGTKGCSATADGLQLCRGEPVDPVAWKLTKRGEFNSYRRVDDTRNLNGKLNGDGKSHKPAVDWHAEAAKHAKRLTAAARAELAGILGLPVEALGAFPLLGWIPDHRVNTASADEGPNWIDAPCWTFPQVDARGKVIGITRRFREPVAIAGGNPTNKAAMAGGLQGLFVPVGWKDRAGPVFIVEGASDVLALSAVGLAAIGRPNNLGGGAELAEMLKDLPADRAIIILGENDAKPNGDWPGKTGAEKVAEVLKAKLGRNVAIVFPPTEVKDARGWVHDLASGFAEAEDWPGLGAAILKHCEQATRPKFPWPDPKYASELSSRGRGVEWIWEGCIARGHRTLFSALMKSGKTTLLSHLLRGLDHGGQFIGRPVRQCRTLVVSEESETIWADRRDALCLSDRLSVISQPTLARLSYSEWVEFLEYVRFHALDRKAELVVIDVLGSFAPWKNENDAAEVTQAMMPLISLTKEGIGVLASHHHGKNDSGEGKAARGSTAMAGAVDILLEMRRYKPDERSDRRRVLSGLGRFDEVPDEIVIALADDGSDYAAEGDKKAVAAREVSGLILEHLPKVLPGATVEDLHAELPENGRPGRGMLGNALRIGATAGSWSSSGTGKKGDPRRFWKG